jgi:hypothetical protein
MMADGHTYINIDAQHIKASSPRLLVILLVLSPQPAVQFIVQMMADGHTYINIDAQHIKASSPRLLAATVESPEDMVLLWDEAVNRLAREQTDLLEEMELQAPEDTIQVGCLFGVGLFQGPHGAAVG